tara:strand:+ start:43563 stop:44645 length:1083 start_codon:yes stop_codon:yes gene_type:complete
MQKEIFKNLKVIDLSTVLAGPSVGTFFAELGAKVVKVEHPTHPDVTRSWKLPGESKEASVSAYFSSINFAKDYISLDLTNNEHHKVLQGLLQDADLVIMNFKKGGQDKLNISDKALHEINPKLIIGKISGFGENSDRVAYDLILQAESGFMSMNGTPNSGPVKIPLALIDVLAAHHLKEGLLIELISREKEQKKYKGGVICVSLYDAAVSSLINQASNYLMTGRIPQRIGSLHPNIAPYGELFKTKDGKTITFAIGSDRHFVKLCSFLNIEDAIKDERFSSTQLRVKNRNELQEIISKSVNTLNADEILNGLNSIFVPCGEVKDLKAVFNDQKAQDLIRKETIDGIETKRVSTIAFKKTT